MPPPPNPILFLKVKSDHFHLSCSISIPPLSLKISWYSLAPCLLQSDIIHGSLLIPHSYFLSMAHFFSILLPSHCDYYPGLSPCFSDLFLSRPGGFEQCSSDRRTLEAATEGSGNSWKYRQLVPPHYFKQNSSAFTCFMCSMLFLLENLFVFISII